MKTLLEPLTRIAAKCGLVMATSFIRMNEVAITALEGKETFEIRYGTVYPAAIRSLQEDFGACLAYYDFAEVLRRYIRTTNALEGLFSNIRLRTNSIKVFQNEESCLKMVWAASQTIKLQKIPVE